MTVEEIADYLKLLGFKVEHDDGLYEVLIPMSHGYSDKVARIWSGDIGVGLYLYGDGSILLEALSKSYTVTSDMGSRYFYDITDSNSRRSN